MAIRDETAVILAGAAVRQGGSRHHDAGNTKRRDREHNPATRAAEPSGFASELCKMLANLARLI
jgi:hypothetical protein